MNSKPAPPAYLSDRREMEILDRLDAWSEDGGSFHGDRQLADEVLIACGWRCEPAPNWAGGVRWFFGVNPQVSVAEDHRPHPVRSLDAAIGQLPMRCDLHQMTRVGDCWRAEAWMTDHYVRGEHRSLPVALCIVAVKACN